MAVRSARVGPLAPLGARERHNGRRPTATSAPVVGHLSGAGTGGRQHGPRYRRPLVAPEEPAATGGIGSRVAGWATVALLVVLVVLALVVPRAAADATVTPPPPGVGTNSGRFPLCDGLEPGVRTQLREGLALMRRTAEGERLFAVLLDRRVCVGVAPLPGRTLARAQARETAPGDWSTSTVIIDAPRMPWLEVDVLAATLVHEAAHIDRAISGTHCAATRSCTVLPSGARLEEEIAAHAAEATWWREVYGDDGKGAARPEGGNLDELLAAYLRGDDAFRDYVAAWRGPDHDDAR